MLRAIQSPHAVRAILTVTGFLHLVACGCPPSDQSTPTSRSRPSSSSVWAGALSGPPTPTLTEKRLLFSASELPKHYYSYGNSTLAFEVASLSLFKGSPLFLIQLDSSTYSGSGLAIDPLDLSKARAKGSLIFWAKGAVGGEQFSIGLGSLGDSHITRSRAKIPRRLGLSTSWQQISIPLAAFPDLGYAWDGKQALEMTANWSNVVEFEVATAPSEENAQVINITIGPVWIEGAL
jgi:hypothetical protein